MKSSFRRIFAVARREFSCSVASPTAWVFLVIFLILSAFFTFVVSKFIAIGQADLGTFFDWMPWLFLFIIPALGMPVWADERRSGTFELTLSFPASLWELVVGKYLAGMMLLLIALLLTASTPLTALFLGKPDIGAIFSGYIGTLLIGSVFLSISSFCSALSRSQTASFLLSLLICAILMFIGLPQLLNTLSHYFPQSILEMIAFCSILPHFQAFKRGIIDTGEVAYCISTTVFFLFLTGAVLRFVSAGLGNIFAPGTMKEKFTRLTIRNLLYSALLAAYSLICVNIIFTTFSTRFDMTSDGAYSLSKEASLLASSITTPATIRFYASTTSIQMPPGLKKYAERVEWLLNEFCKASNGMIKMQMINPEQNSTDEEAALLEGINPHQLNTGERLFLGLSVSYANRSIPIPFLDPAEESMLEYEVARAIMNVTRKKKPQVGVISSFPVLVTPSQPTAQTARPYTPPERSWYSLVELQRDMDVYLFPVETAQIPDNIEALLIIQPCSFPPKTLYAVDQYLMRGGRLALFLDSHSLYARLKANSDSSFAEKTSSDFEPLLSAWGLDYNRNLMVADMNYARRTTTIERNITDPLTLYIPPEGISRTNPLTSSLQSIWMYYPGFLKIKEEMPLLKYETLLSTSKNSQVVRASEVSYESVIRRFKSSNTNFILGERISGAFPSAYPSGSPDAAAADIHKRHLPFSERPSTVFVFTDADMIFNDACVRTTTDALGQVIIMRQNNNNLTLLQNVMDQLCGSETLTSIRGRVPMNRPLTKINEIKARAELKYKDRIEALHREAMEASRGRKAVDEYLKRNPGTTLTHQQKKAYDNYVYKSNEISRELKAWTSQLKADLDRLDNIIIAINLILIPALVTIAGITWSTFRLKKWRRRR